MEAAVVARPDEKWGETPCAFVALSPDAPGRPSVEEIIAFCRERIAHKGAEDGGVRTAAQDRDRKIQKFVLREGARGTADE